MTSVTVLMERYNEIQAEKTRTETELDALIEQIPATEEGRQLAEKIYNLYSYIKELETQLDYINHQIAMLTF